MSFTSPDKLVIEAGIFATFRALPVVASIVNEDLSPVLDVAGGNKGGISSASSPGKYRGVVRTSDAGAWTSTVIGVGSDATAAGRIYDISRAVGYRIGCCHGMGTVVITAFEGADAPAATKDLANVRSYVIAWAKDGTTSLWIPSKQTPFTRKDG